MKHPGDGGWRRGGALPRRRFLAGAAAATAGFTIVPRHVLGGQAQPAPSDRLNIAVGVDDVIVEAIAGGAVGWVAGLVNALPAESIALFNRAKAGDFAGVWPLYRWFLPLLRLDVVPKFVQLIKLVQEAVGMVGDGGVTTRAPRLALEGEELAATRALIEKALAERPTL